MSGAKCVSLELRFVPQFPNYGFEIAGFVPDGHESAVIALYGGRITEIAWRALAKTERFGPRAAFIFADPGNVAERFATVTVSHEKTSIREFRQVRGDSPNADFVNTGPCFAAVFGFGLKGFLIT